MKHDDVSRGSVVDMTAPSPDLDGFRPASLRALARALEGQARYHRLEVRGLEHVPRGPAVLVGNHSGGGAPVDGLFLARYYARFGFDEPVHVLAHDFFFRTLRAGPLLSRVGVLPATPEGAARALDRGRKVLVFPGTDHDALRPFSARKEVRLNGHKGFARLAVAHGAPVVPVVSAGGHESFVVLAQGKKLASLLGVDRRFRWHSFPIVACLPWGLAIGPMAYAPYLPLPAKITVQIEPPIDPGELSGRSDAERVDALYAITEARMRERLTTLYAEREWPILG